MKELKDFTLLEQFILTRWFYSIGQPLISDAQYTVLLRAVEAQFPDSKYVKRSWSSDPCPVELLKEFGREDAILAVVSTDRTESIPSLNSWTEIENALKDWKGNGTVSFKHDGWNIQAHYYNGKLLQVNTRGRSSDFMNADQLRKLIPSTIHLQGQIRIVMECTISNTNWPEVKQKYSGISQRSSVATILAHTEDIDYLDLHAVDIHGVKTRNKFQTLQELGFMVPTYEVVNDYDSIESSIYYLSEVFKEYDSPTDGLVFDGGYKYAIRVEEWEEKLYKSYVIGYEESYNKYVISPKLVIKPIYREGAIQRYIPITNWQRIIDLDLRPGSPIAFNLVSGAIADIDEISTKALQQEYKDNYVTYAHEIDTINSVQ